MDHEEMQECGFWVRKPRSRVWPWSSLCLVVLLLAIHLDTVTADSCNTTCGNQKLLYPFGVGDGCGSTEFRDQLKCKTEPPGLWLYIGSNSYEVCEIDFRSSYIVILNDNQADCSKINQDTGLVWRPDLKNGTRCSSRFSIDKSAYCNSCENNNGVCGYNTTDDDNNKTVCRCSSAMDDTQCKTLESSLQSPPPPSPEFSPLPSPGTAVTSLNITNNATASSSSSITKVTAGVGGAGATLLVTVIGFICFRRWRSWSNSRVRDKQMKHMVHIQSAGSPGISGVTTFTYKELATATKNFEKPLGGGGYNTVYQGKLKDGRLVAVKKLNQANSQGRQQFMAELTVLSKARHRNLVQLYGCCLEHRDPLLVYEYVAKGTLADNLYSRHTNLECTTRVSIAIEVAEALAYLHSLQPPIFHRDVKSTNILLDRNFVAKVADFGLSRLSEPFRTHVSTAPQGTPGYLDPDYHQTYHLSDKSDVYSLGVVLMELITGLPAVDMSRERGEINLAAMATSRIQNGTLDELLDPRLDLNRGNVKEVAMALGELGFQCLATEKDDRPSMREVVTKLRSAQYLALAIPSPMASPLHPQAQETRVLIKSTSSTSVDWTHTQAYPDLGHELVGR